jgi:hypothetical protein
MYALILHKDLLFKISQFTKKLFPYLDTDFIPLYPHWAFTQENLLNKKIIFASLENAVFEDDKIFIPLKIKTSENEIKIQINLFKTKNKNSAKIKIPSLKEANINTQLKIFRIAQILEEEGMYSVVKEKWIKLP